MFFSGVTSRQTRIFLGNAGKITVCLSHFFRVARGLSFLKTLEHDKIWRFWFSSKIFAV
jgi:hypothetical protein